MTQSQFARALLDPDAAVPAGLVDPLGRPAPKRFAVYRNNVFSSLTSALEAAFPTVRKLVGDDFFAAMAREFLRAHPPTSRILMLYGAAMPEFLAGFRQVAHLAYLPDVARLDQAIRESYHAADSAPLPEAEFQRLLGEDIASLRLTLAPSLRVVRSRWPVHAIWAANHESGPAPQAVVQDVVVLRPEFDPRPWPLPPGTAAFLAGLLEGRTLGDSLDMAGGTVDLSVLLALLISNRAIIGAAA
ncbi:MAG: DNA-binding domain-containing protein [Pseudomonadota bacterium]